MDDQKEEIENLRKQIKSLKIGLMLTQISTIVFTIILGRQCLRSIQNYHYLLRQMSMCLEYAESISWIIVFDNCLQPRLRVRFSAPLFLCIR